MTLCQPPKRVSHQASPNAITATTHLYIVTRVVAQAPSANNFTIPNIALYPFQRRVFGLAYILDFAIIISDALKIIPDHCSSWLRSRDSESKSWVNCDSVSGLRLDLTLSSKLQFHGI